MESGVATRPIADFAAYREQLSHFVFRSGLVMKPLFERAKRDPKRVVYAEGEDERVLRAVQSVVDERLAQPILIGRRRVIESRLRQLGLRLKPAAGFRAGRSRERPALQGLLDALSQSDGAQGRLARRCARRLVRTRTTVIAALMVQAAARPMR